MLIKQIVAKKDTQECGVWDREVMGRANYWGSQIKLALRRWDCSVNSRPYAFSFVPRSAGYLCWFHGLYAWHKYQPEMILYFVQVIIQWIFSENKILAEAGRLICARVSTQGVRQLALPLANALLAVLRDVQIQPTAHRCALNHLLNCPGIYHQLGKDFVLELVESVTSWKYDLKTVKVTSEGIECIIGILSVVLVDDQAAFVATRHLLQWEVESFFGKSNEAAVRKQKLLDLLMESTAHG